MKTIFLCGQINGCTDAEAKWIRYHSKHVVHSLSGALEVCRRL